MNDQDRNELNAIIAEGYSTVRGILYRNSIESGMAALEAAHARKQELKERAAWNIDLAIADLILAVTQCRTVSDALKLRRQVEPLILKLQAVESSCLHKADALCGAGE